MPNEFTPNTESTALHEWKQWAVAYAELLNCIDWYIDGKVDQYQLYSLISQVEERLCKRIDIHLDMLSALLRAVGRNPRGGQATSAGVAPTPE